MFDDEPDYQDPVVVTGTQPGVYPDAWELQGLSIGELLFGPGYGDLLVDSPLVLAPVLVQGTDQSGQDDGVDGARVWTETYTDENGNVRERTFVQPEELGFFDIFPDGVVDPSIQLNNVINPNTGFPLSEGDVFGPGYTMMFEGSPGSTGWYGQIFTPLPDQGDGV